MYIEIPVYFQVKSPFENDAGVDSFTNVVIVGECKEEAANTHETFHSFFFSEF